MNNISGFISQQMSRASFVAPDAKTSSDDDNGSSMQQNTQPFETILSGFSQSNESESNSALSAAAADGDEVIPGQATKAMKATQEVALHSLVPSSKSSIATSAITSNDSPVAIPLALGLSVSSSDGTETQNATGSLDDFSSLTGNQAYLSGRGGSPSRAQADQDGTSNSSAAISANARLPQVVSQTLPPTATASASGSDQQASDATATVANPSFKGDANASAVRSGSQGSISATRSSMTGESTPSRRHDDGREDGDEQLTESTSAVSALAVTPIAVPVPTAMMAPAKSASTPVKSSGVQSVSAPNSAVNTPSSPDIAAPTTNAASADLNGVDISDSLSASGSFGSSDAFKTNTKVDVVSQATHFAPVTSLSPTQQIIAAIVPALAPSFAQDTSGGADTAAVQSNSVSPLQTVGSVMQPSQVSIKTLDLTLEPADLGAVNVKLNLSSDGLAVDLTANQANTADLIERDKKSLSDGLTAAGYNVTSIDTSFAPASMGISAGSSDQNNANGNASQSFDGAPQGNADAQSQNGGAQDSSSRQYQQQASNDPSEQVYSGIRRSGGGSFYI